MELSIHPNPTNARNINFDVVTGDDHTPMQIRMLDISGKLVFEKSLNPQDLAISDRIVPMIETKAGLYFITLVQGDVVLIKKVILNE
jgi:hypothetical protein